MVPSHVDENMRRAVKEQRFVFGEDAELYDRVRPGYPPALFDDLVDECRVEPPDGRALDVGAGTGKATAALGAKGIRVVALEADANMARVARRRCAPFPSVEIVESTFEEWSPGKEAFDLVTCAQAWHWMRPGVRCTRAADALAVSGCLALFWHRVRWRKGDLLHDALVSCYETLAPELLARGPGFPGLEPEDNDGKEREQEEIVASGRFGPVEIRRYPWTASYDARGYAALLSTQSDHRMLPEALRATLLEHVEVVVREAGEPLVVPFETLLLTTHRSR